MNNITFITENNLRLHIKNSIEEYTNTLETMDLQKFNSNIIDPIKLLFDKKVSRKSFEEIVMLEIQRQRDKTNSNIIGYFHQNIFQYINNCEVPNQGFDVIYTNPMTMQKIFVELKNKHNTMNSKSSQATYIKMQSGLLEKPNDLFYLVEIISKKSQNIIWNISIESERYSNEKIRKVSIDKFYAEITGDGLAFYKICEILPSIIDEVLEMEMSNRVFFEDTVLEELKNKNPNILKSLYLLAFKTYNGFSI